ncbi:TPM domain-containing protein [Lachnoclostridium sp. An169]|uniref:TPM domain-containing protein n=1 Tax=Lachnoclostridium sp. An169 TaxID=1965569 RepID=UPI001FA838AD|nr:TPM domain-containing protein [Lachnoclostridium sp. An169]
MKERSLTYPGRRLAAAAFALAAISAALILTDGTFPENTVLTAYAETVGEYSLEGEMPEERQLPRLVDNADLLTEEEESELLAELDEISERQAFDVAVVTVDSLEGRTPREYADDFYDYNGYGMGPGNDGALLLISMEARDWYITTAGYGITALTDDGLEYISDEIVPYLSDGEYKEAFETYARLCDEFVTEARSGHPYKGDHMPRGSFNWAVALLISLVIGGIASAVAVETMRSRLKTVRPRGSAADYVRPGSMVLVRQEDCFLHASVSRRARPKDTGSGSSTHRSSSGVSHGGRGGKF